MTLYHSLTAAHRTQAMAAFASRTTEHLLEGDHRWGSIEVSPAGRTSWNRTRLTVYPPGTNHAERRALHFYRTWPVVGAVVALFTILALSAWPPLAATAAAVAVYALGLLAGFRMTRHLRPRLRRLSVVLVATGGGTETLGDIDFYNTATDEFRALDRLHDAGLVSAAEYELAWAKIYNALP
ncbi:hypothetical protein B7R54_04560 [Subtercola boreus]|uniref:Uncharacterized protein n=1 Tax=Subtercola boreus TaxID=120213 RepID=A0A3E0VGL3_9MICO|nr:DUF6611 family protein [Subtercola boreus]RFA08578.1 hypothetical protein B7R54_04560 [Subtercola boreus]TQL54486.1 hypothetical protein FB464_2025 [Subtercola boreus]